jgi:hypothetical protein
MIDPKVITEILKANGITSRSAPGSPLGNLTGVPFRDPSEIPAGSGGPVSRITAPQRPAHAADGGA